MFRELYRELNEFDAIALNEIYNNPDILQAYKKHLLHFNKSAYFRNYILESLYLGNPLLVPSTLSITDEKKEDVSKEVKLEFEKKIKAQIKILTTAKEMTTQNPAILHAYAATFTQSTRNALNYTIQEKMKSGFK